MIDVGVQIAGVRHGHARACPERERRLVRHAAIYVEAWVDPEVAPDVRDVVGQLLRIGSSQLRPQAGEPIPDADARLLARVARVNLLSELEVIRDVGVGDLCAGTRTEVVAG